MAPKNPMRQITPRQSFTTILDDRTLPRPIRSLDQETMGKNVAMTPTTPPIAMSLPLNPNRENHCWNAGAPAGPGTSGLAMAVSLPSSRCEKFPKRRARVRPDEGKRKRQSDAAVSLLFRLGRRLGFDSQIGQCLRHRAE